jgi:ribonuclease T1
MLLRSGPRALAGLLLCGAVLLTGCGATGTSVRTITSTGSRSATVPKTGSDAPTGVPGWAAGLPTVMLARLPAEADRTLQLIDQGGPFPYPADGVVFGNFERHLPLHPRGYYHEYTVRTPGERDRGARRLITGQGGELFYTQDHYNSFKAVLK